jgi:hypothetical protein
VFAAAIHGANERAAQRPPLGRLEPAQQRAVQQVDRLDSPTMARRSVAPSTSGALAFSIAVDRKFDGRASSR